jgi:hypothetical protein
MSCQPPDNRLQRTVMDKGPRFARRGHPRHAGCCRHRPPGAEHRGLILSAALERAKSDPAGFAGRLSPETLQRLRELSTKISDAKR